MYFADKTTIDKRARHRMDWSKLRAYMMASPKYEKHLMK